MPYVYEDLGLGVTTDDDGRSWFLARDNGAYRGRLLHPQFLPVDFDVPQRTKAGKETPIKVKLQRGALLTFVLHLGKQRINLTNNLNVRVRDAKRRSYVLYWHQPIGNVDHKLDTDNVMRLQSPAALRPGKYSVHLRLYGTKVSLNTNVTLTAGQPPVVIEFKDGKARQLPAEGTVKHAPPAGKAGKAGKIKAVVPGK